VDAGHIAISCLEYELHNICTGVRRRPTFVGGCNTWSRHVVSVYSVRVSSKHNPLLLEKLTCFFEATMTGINNMYREDPACWYHSRFQ
jgi:hypothetical protein